VGFACDPAAVCPLPLLSARPCSKQLGHSCKSVALGDNCSLCVRLVFLSTEGRARIVEKRWGNWYIDGRKQGNQRRQGRWERISVIEEEHRILVRVQEWMRLSLVPILTLPWPILSLHLYLPDTAEAIVSAAGRLECAQDCTEACSSPSSKDCTGLLASSQHPTVNPKAMDRDWTVTWWTEELRPRTKYVQLGTIACLEGKREADCEGLRIVSEESAQLQLCLFQGQSTQCSAPRPVYGWSEVQLSYSKERISLCLATSQGSDCMHFSSQLFQSPAVLTQETLPAWTRGDLEWSSVPLEQGRVQRQLLVTHYAGWMRRRTIVSNGIHYYTFVNTHVKTTRIRFEVTGSNIFSSLPKLYVYKPYSAAADWSDTVGSNRIVSITSTNSVILAKGGSMTGSYTVKLANTFISTYTYQVRVLIECQEPSQVCFCPTGSFPDPDTASCSVCPPADSDCANISTVGCVAATEGTVPALGTFNCKTCYPTQNFLSPSDGDCISCHSNCATCVESGSNYCLSCTYAGTRLATPLGPSACVCNPGTYPDPSITSCSSCHLTCLTCSAVGISKCTGCKPGALLSGPASTTCLCGPGYLGSADSCVACHPSCATCSSIAVSGCLTCKVNALLTGTAPSTCECSPGFYGTSDDCYLTCHPECYTCIGSTNLRCTGCVAVIARLDGASCVCSDGYYGTSPNCLQCNGTCLKCAGVGAGQCTACKTNASIASSIPGTCACDIDFYPAPDSSNCQHCDSSCLTCAGLALSQCTACKSHATLSNSSSPSTCICDPGFYPDPTPANCQVCYAACLECSGGTASLCTSCKSNAALSGSSPNSCVCGVGFSWNTLSSSCHTCDMTCLYCSDVTASSCTDCWPHAVLNPETGPGKCECQFGFFASPTSQTCLPCHLTCRLCTKSSASGCLDCYDFAQLSGSVCICISKAYADPDAASCRPCHINCSSCIGPMFSQCSSCEGGAYLPGPAPSFCLCSSGFYPSPDASQCAPCLAVCGACRDSMTCVSCNSHAVLSAELLCECVPGTFGQPDASNCILCPPSCKSCYDIGCLDCLPGYYQLGASCYDTCPIGYSETSDLVCEAADMSEPIPTLTVGSNNTLTVSFDRPMNFTLSSTDFSIEVLTSNGDLSPVTWSEPEFHSSDNITIPLLFQAPYLPSGSQANLTFHTPSQVLSAQHIPMTLPYLTATLQAFGTSPSNHTSLQASSSVKQAAAAAGGVMATSAVTSIVSGPSGFLSLVNQLQLITYLSMTKIPIAQGFAGTLAALNVGGMLSNPLKDYLDTNITIAEAVAPPDYIENYGIETVLFLTNVAVFLGVTGVIFASFIPTYFLTKSRNAKIALYCRTRMKSLTFSTPLKAWFTAYLDLCVFSLLQVSQLRVSLVGVYGWVSLLAAVVFVLLTWATPFLLILFTIKYRRKMMQREDECFNERWGALFLPFVKSEKAAVLAFYSVFVVRRLLLAAMLVLLPSFISLFVVLNCSFSVISVLYLLFSKPYEGKLDQAEAMAIEIGTAFIYFLAGSFSLSLSDTVRSTLDQVGIWAVRALIGTSSFFSLLRCSLAVGAVVKAFVRGRRTVYGLREVRESVKAGEGYEIPDLRGGSSWLN